MAIKIIPDRDEPRGRHSGYGQLASHLEATVLDAGRGLGLRARLPGKTLYHFFAGEKDLRVPPRLRPRLNNRLVATFHLPPERLEAEVAPAAIAELDAAIATAACQVGVLSRHLPFDRIFVVPHGVDTGFWRPDPAVAKAVVPTVLTLGTCDAAAFAAAVRRVAALAPEVRFRVVARAEDAARFAGLPATEVLIDVGEQHLLREYRRAHALFLPLAHGTAIPELLEAMSCGTGVVATQVGGIVDYVDAHAAALVPPGDVDAAVAALCAIARDPSWALRAGAAARSRAERFRWETVGEQLDYVHRRILGSNCRAFFRQDKRGPRNICLLTEEYPPETGWGGIATYGYNLAQGLAAAGHRVFVISGCIDRPSITTHDGVEVHRVKFQPKEGWKKRFWEKRILPRLAKYPETRRRIEFALAARKRFRYLFDRTPIHLIESPEYFGSLYAIQWMRRRCPTMIKLHTPSEVNCWVNDVPVSEDIRRSNILEKGSTRRADKITAPSRKIIDIVTQRWLPGVPGIELLEYPIDTDVYSPGPGRVTPRKHFLFTGRLEHRKGVHLLVEAFAKVAAEIPDFDLHLAGHDTPTFARDGRSGMKFLEWIEGADIAPEVRKRIEFLGRIPLRELIPLYRGAYACIIPSTSFENFPNSCLEAIACGKAVIVSDAGGMVEMVEHMQSGIHVKANDVHSLAAAIRHLAQHPEETARFGRRSREIVLERYATEKIVARTMDVFERVIQKGRYR